MLLPIQTVLQFLLLLQIQQEARRCPICKLILLLLINLEEEVVVGTIKDEEAVVVGAVIRIIE